ncbi:restriction endonuclease subunit S [Gelidibacter pelagius]|uniref:Restriction endonuclease subunit S n=1 Tax=Gelidibacter pelagius TaxID=2819985 RepID=A0ABS3SRH0_9FLAO|nr:restriction endonuclease subunit S [Gelidibacter pelagius]MBO3098290.1 restriction endonuclease subunit S [Gelidibacter pelagius]
METMISEQISIDKSDWTPVKFGDVVFEPKESSKDPKADGIKHVVGLEHIESEDIHLRHSANLDTSTTFSKGFAEGDVLFGRRRAYLKKAAQAKFSGICSGDITVLRAKDNLLPQLLPFIVQNDKFFDYAIKHSAGGLSPRVKFKDLANYEFLLPPKDQQAKLAELLWAMDEVIERENEVLEKIDISKRTYEKKWLNKYTSGIEKKLPINYKVYRLSEIAEITGGSTPSRDVKEFWNGDIPWLTPTDVTNHNRITLDRTKEYITESGLRNISNRLYPIGSLLYCSRATIGHAIINDVPMATNQGFSNFICNEKVTNYFLYFLLKYLTNELTRLAGGSTFLEISKSSIRRFRVVIPPKGVMKNITGKLLEYENTRLELESKISSSKALQKSLINQVF